MSRLLILQNQLKIRARADRLADHQLAVYRDIVDRWRYSEKLNLYGPAGAGKTFLGWALAYEQEATFFAAPEIFLETNAPSPQGPVIVDNIDTDPYQLRRLLAALQLHDIHAALFISRQPNPGLLPTLHLPPPGAKDRTVVLHNLSELDYYTNSPPENADLWQLVRATL
jgi:hypothetical protein